MLFGSRRKQAQSRKLSLMILIFVQTYLQVWYLYLQGKRRLAVLEDRLEARFEGSLKKDGMRD